MWARGLGFPPRFVKTQVSRLWAVALSLCPSSDRKAAGFLHPGRVWRSCPVPPAPTAQPQALLQGESGGRPLAFVLGSRLSMQVRACEGAPPGSPSC